MQRVLLLSGVDRPAAATGAAGDSVAGDVIRRLGWVKWHA